MLEECAGDFNRNTRLLDRDDTPLGLLNRTEDLSLLALLVFYKDDYEMNLRSCRSPDENLVSELHRFDARKW